MASISPGFTISAGPYAAAGHWMSRSRKLTRHGALTAFEGVPLVYAMRVPGNLIKIGHSRNIAARVRHLHGEMLAVKIGDRDDEALIHQSLTEHVAKGVEYYTPTPQVLDVVNEMRTALGLPSIAA